MFIETKQAFIFNGMTERGQICLVEPKSYKRMYLLPPKEATTIDVKELKEDKKYNFVLAVILDIQVQKAKLDDKNVYLNNVKMYINDIQEFVESAE